MLKLPGSGLAAFVLTAAVFVTLHAAAADPGRLVAIVGGVAVSPVTVASIVVDSDAMQPDMATVTIQPGRGPLPKPGNSLSVDLEGVKASGTIFKGEVVGVEPIWDASGSSRVVIRAFNKLHRLTRARKTRTFEKMTDSDIASRIAEENELGFGRDLAEASPPHDYVFQNNQTDLEFLRTRAARIGYQVWVDDSTLYFQRDGVKESVSLGLGCTAKPGPTVGLRTFHPRLSSVDLVSEVTVRGWDPKKKEEIVGHASRRIIPLSDPAANLLSPPGQSLDLGSTFALDTNGGAYGAANGALSALTAEDISAEVVTEPSAALRARLLLVVDTSGSMNRFAGKYYVTAARHVYRPGAQGGMLSFARLLRDDRGIYVLPELGDDVYVAFDQGDIAHPYIVGSLWNGTDTTHEKPACGN